MQAPKIEIGQQLTCSVTGKRFIAAIDGITTNYATDSKGNIFSDDGVNIAELAEIKDRSKPFSAYLSSDGKHITGWKGNELMRVVYAYQSNAGFAGGWRNGGQWIVSAVDRQGEYWHGRNGGKGMIITLRPCGKPKPSAVRAVLATMCWSDDECAPCIKLSYRGRVVGKVSKPALSAGPSLQKMAEKLAASLGYNAMRLHAPATGFRKTIYI